MDKRKVNRTVGLETLQGSFGPRPHDFYLAYDPLSDELIVRLIDPRRPTYLHEIDDRDDFGLIVELESNEAVGFHLFNFEASQLADPVWFSVRRLWPTIKAAAGPSGYRLMRHEPEGHARSQTEPLNPTPRFIRHGAQAVQRELVKHPG